jgi:hypothetical protein
MRRFFGSFFIIFGLLHFVEDLSREMFECDSYSDKEKAEKTERAGSVLTRFFPAVSGVSVLSLSEFIL